MRIAATAVSAVTIARPLAEIAENETAITMFTKPAGIVQHDRELLVFKLPPGFEFRKIDAAQHGIVRFENAHAAASLSLDLLDVPETLKQRDRGVESMVVGSG